MAHKEKIYQSKKYILIIKTKLIEFKNNSDDILRGILLIPKNAKLRKGVIFLHGFERAGTTEKKFKKLADKLVEEGIFSFRFDYTGCGLSDGDFRTYYPVYEK